MRKSFKLYLLSLTVFNALVFGNGYFFNFKLPIPLGLIVVLAVIFSILPWFSDEKMVLSKKTPLNVQFITRVALMSIVSIMLMLGSLFVSLFATMYVPGSREHNYVMYRICLPAMTEHYADRKPADVPDLFKLHSKCEQNVWAGRDPLDGLE